VPAFVPSADALARFRREIDRTAVRARNGVKHLSGFSAAAVGQSPKDLVWTRDKVSLHRYTGSPGFQRRRPLLLVMSLVTRPYVFDLRPGNSLVARLVDDGHDVYLLDWGIPDAVEAENTIETYCDEYLPHAARAVLEVSGADGLT
jgi:polyhydroxyalkanoate synthase